MSPTLVAGGLKEDAQLEVVGAPGDEPPLLRYKHSPRTSGSYSISISPRISAVVSQGEQGWIAQAAELNALGYGDTWEAALLDLRDSIEQYLEYLREDQPQLAPSTLHHSLYVDLLNTPPELWFGSVRVDAATLE